MRRLIMMFSLVLFVAWNPLFTGCGPGSTDKASKETTRKEQVDEPASSAPDEPASSAPDEPASSAPDEPASSAPDEPGTKPDASTELTPELKPETSTETAPEGSSETKPEGGVAETKPEGGVAETKPEVTSEMGPEGGATDGGVAVDVTPERAPETVVEFSGTGPDPNAAAQIRAIRAGTPGKVGQVAVTYVKAKHGNDGAGFFVQATPLGPALFVAIDPATTTPLVKPGHIITFEVTKIKSYNTSSKRLEVQGIKDLKVVKGGYDTSKLGQDITTNNDVVSALGSYSDELIRLEGKIASPFTSAGTGFVSGRIETKGVKGTEMLRLRVPIAASGGKALSDTLGLAVGCFFSTKLIPMWRFGQVAQPSAFKAHEITIKSCPAPKLLKAEAGSATTVVLTFSRPIDKTTVKSNGSDFLFDNGLSATKAVVDGNTITVTTTTQDGTKLYTVTASAAIKDNRGKVLDSTALAVKFKGYNASAVVLINEFNNKIKGGCDLVELRVSKGGSMNGISLYNKSSRVVTFSNFVVKKNDIFVVHFDAKDTKCVPSQPKNETTSVKEVANSTVPQNFDTAYDWYTTNSGFSTTTGVVSLRDAKGTYLDVVFFTKTTGTTARSTLTAANLALKAKQWTAASGTAPATYTDANFKTDAAVHTAAGSSVASNSVQRKSNTDTNSKKDWTDANPSTWGKKNTGQTDF